MRSKFDQQLHTLNTKLTLMGSHIEEIITMSNQALIQQDIEIAKTAINMDQDINALEKEIESLCLKLLLQQQPVASDLRTISSALKMITDMERIGDQASDISEITTFLATEPNAKQLITECGYLSEMANATIKMVTDSIDAFISKNLEQTKSVMAYDDVVDDLFDKTRDYLIDLIRQNIDYSRQAIDLLMIAKYYERIGDHAVNIAEWVEFSITGQHKNTKII